MNAIICEDHKADAARLHRILESGGFHVVATFENGRQMMDWLLKHPNEAEIVFLDIIMPVLDGYAAFWEIREYKLNVRVVFVSVENSQSVIASVLKLGAQSYITKPFERESVLEHVNKAIKLPLPVWK
ncbi:MAG: response regulator [Leptospiraceae bacterium]|nr:response regulator [Leptospiraceae bacterium]MCB1322390.1 response regulator [Leptospiraceae bacterium]